MANQPSAVAKGEEESGAMTKTTLRLPTDLHRRLKVLAVQQGRHMEALAAEALEHYVGKSEKSSRAKK